MIFNSGIFFGFAIIVFAAMWLGPKRAQNTVLLVASYIFYGWWDWRFLGLLAFSTVSDFLIGRAMPTASDVRRRRLLMTSVAVNLGLLGVFKYFNFFVDSAVDALGTVGLNPSTPVLRVVLPVGISFYTFQTLSYSFDVYRRRIEPCRSLIDFATFVAYFPQLVAGPVERAHRLLPQITAQRARPNGSQIQSGITLFVFGLVKKVAIADIVAPIVDRGFTGDPAQLSSTEVAVAMLGFAVQIYADFSGYTDMARGISRLLNIELMRNFEQPYLSRNITEFWRRWHVSLSTWLRDYLYIPLGGNRGSDLATYRNVLITMLLGGLWHGAGWNFVFWGAIHGFGLIIHRWAGGSVSTAPLRFRDIPAITLTFGFVVGAWVFFRAPTVSHALQLFGRLGAFETNNLVSWDAILVGLAITVLLGLDLFQRSERDRRVASGRSPAWAGVTVGVGIVAVVIASGAESTPFIYFQF